MTNEPQIKTLAHAHRKYFFWFLVLVFVIALPSLIFYTTGYRLSFDNEETSIETTGGIYITAENLEVDVYLDEEQVKQPRLFRSAYYVKNIEVGQHRIVVQRPDLQTWVKELPVDPYIVVEASAFNMPVLPHVRPVTEYVSESGEPVYLNIKDSTDLFSGVTTTIPVLLSKTSYTTNLELNEEYVFVESLFSTSSRVTRSVFSIVERFRFSTTSDSDNLKSTSTELVIEKNNIRLVNLDRELYAQWHGVVEDIPYYFCVSDMTASSTEFRYGSHVAKEIERFMSSATTTMLLDDNRYCRPEIKLDRMRQDVYFYQFFPNSSDLVLLQLEDGLYVTEIDDRSWQNSQLLYKGEDFKVVVENDLIFIQEDGRFFEVITEIEPI